MPDTDRRSNPWPLLIAACAILAIALGIRHSFGIYLAPMSHDNGWGREVFAFAIALQNLVWGAAQPFAGRIADRYGAGRAVALGSVFYVAGLIGMATISSASGFILVSGLLLGIGLAGASFAVVFGAVGRVVAAENVPGERVSSGERYAAVYEINLSRCIFCGYCVEACPTDAITHGHGFELASYNTSTLVMRKEDMLVPFPPVK